MGDALNYLHALGETVSIAFLGTLGGALLAFPVSLLAARNVVANRIVQFPDRAAASIPSAASIP